MKSTTATYKSILASKSARHYLIKIDLELASGTTLHLTGADIWEDSFSIDTASSGTSSFDIGTAVIGQCKFTLNNINGTFDNYDFFNAEATVWLGLEGDVSGSPATQQYYRMGFYTVDEPSKANGLISLTLLDNMWKFDVPFSEAGVTFTSQTTARSIVNTMCSHCGVTLATQSFHGYDFSITSAPEEIDEMNCREMLQYIAMIGCNFCFMDDTGALNIKWYNVNATSSTTVTCDLNQNASFGTENITVTGVKFVLDDTEYTRGSDGYVLELENPLVNTSNVSSVLNLIWATGYLKNFSLRTYSITTASDLSAEIGDKIKILDYKGNYTYSWITTNSFKLAAHLMQCNAEPPNRTLIKRYSNEVKSAVSVARKEAVQLISTYDQSVQRLNKLVEQSMGAYSDYEDAQSGGRIYYISNMPITKSGGVCTFESGSVVFRMAGDVFSVSRDGGQTWVNGYDPTTGELVVNVLNAIGINAEWIRTGTLTVGGATSGTQHPTIEVYDSNDNLICEINRNGITMHRGIISSPDYAEVSGEIYSTTGMKLDVLNKILRSPYFAIDTNGAYFRGTIQIRDDLEIGTNSFSFVPAEYNIATDFTLVLQAPEGFSGSVSYEVLKTRDGRTGDVEKSGTITDDTPEYITLESLITTSYYYKVTVGSGTTIKAYIEDATFAYVGQDGFKGILEGRVNGSLYSDYGNISGLRYGSASDGSRLGGGIFEYTNMGVTSIIDLPNTNVRKNSNSIAFSDTGCLHVSGNGDYNNNTLLVLTGPNGVGGNAIYMRGGGSVVPTIVKSVSDGQGSYVETPVPFVTYSSTDTPPQSLADGDLFLVYE